MPLELSGVSHSYRQDRMVLDGIDLTIADGTTVAIVGPSGSGKTTLLSILGGLLRPMTGTLLLDGKRVRRGGLPVGSVTWVFQTVNLLGHRSAEENVAIGLLAQGHTHREARNLVNPILSAVGLEGFGDRRANSLSGGEAQRVGIARALAGRPRFLLTDEPTAELDRSTSMLVGDALFGARPERVTVVVSTHDLLVAERCERVISMVDGKLQES